MTDILDIIKTPLIDPETDIFWNKALDIPAQDTAVNTLIISSAFTQGSAEEQQLTKILEACKISAADYKTVQLQEGEQIAWHQLKNAYKPAIVILFGILPQSLGIAALLRLNGLNNFDGVTWVPTLSLQQLEQQPQAKKELWVNALKPLYADNK